MNPIAIHSRLVCSAAGVIALIFLPQAVLGSVAAVAAKVEPRQRQAVLSATNEIRADLGGGALYVRLPRDTYVRRAKFSAASPNIQVRGTSSFSAFVLQATPELGDVGLIAGAFRRCLDEGACAARPVAFAFPFHDSAQPSRIDLPAGLYRLYAISNRAPTNIALTLPGLNGRSHLLAKGVIDSQFTPLTSELLDGQVPNLHTAGDEFEIANERGLGLFVNWLSTELTSVDIQGHCMWHEAPPPQPVAYFPGCEAAGAVEEGRDIGIHSPAGSSQSLSISVRANLEPGLWNYGIYYVTPATVRSAGGFAFWLQL